MSEDTPENDEAGYEPLSTEDWEIALAAYEGRSGAALSFGFNLMILKSYLQIEPLKIQEAIDGIDCALEVLFPHTEFHLVSFDYFLKVVEGRLTREEEEILKSLGIKF